MSTHGVGVVEGGVAKSVGGSREIGMTLKMGLNGGHQLLVGWEELSL